MSTHIPEGSLTTSIVIDATRQLRQLDWVETLKCFLYHKDIPEDIVDIMTDIRQQYVDLAVLIVKLIPRESRSKSLALTYLEDSLMRAIQALALEGKPDIYVYPNP